MTDEEKKAIESLKKDLDCTVITFCKAGLEDIKIVLNLIEKQSKEIEELKEENENLLDALNNSIDIRKYWVSKDKIKAKIEEEDKLFFKTKDVRHANRYKAYKELLEKE